MAIIEKLWYQNNKLSWLLYPLSEIFRLIIFLRRIIIIPKKHTLPVIVVGNINVGGSGKTPLVIELVHYLQQQGYNPAVISRGYPHKIKNVLRVTDKTSAKDIGDEPKLIANRTKSVVMVSLKRNLAISELIASYPEVDIVVSDDGLQHYSMGRDIEIVVTDGKRRYGNQRLLPMGPLREPVSRTKQADLLVTRGNPYPGEFLMEYSYQDLYCLANYQLSSKISDFSGRTVHMVAGIANPKWLQDFLQQHNITVIEHIFADHHLFTQQDLQFYPQYPIIMTEKDAVKCIEFATNDCWVLPIKASLTDEFYAKFRQLLEKLNDR